MRFIPLILLVFAAAPGRAEGLLDGSTASERKILGANQLEPIEAVKGTSAYDLARPIARVEDEGDAEFPGYGYCTGAQVGPRLFLTNLHCDHDCAVMLFHLGYERDVGDAAQQLYRCHQLLAKSETLDYALYEVEPVPSPTGAPEVEYPVLTLSRAPLAAGQPLYLASHPSGRRKEIDRSVTCKLGDVAVFHTDSGRDSVKHLCDSESGSSGAPLLDRATGAAVGLHWGGKDGQYNMAVPMPLILGDLVKQLPAATWQKLHVTD